MSSLEMIKIELNKSSIYHAISIITQSALYTNTNN